ncbi:competence protein ComEA [Geodermatophilus amargosae]|uniref:Competence protein ComEA n=1 Tax=Geodermatophilus amargosae TaxID=1296565 RepID=A0A1I7CFN3_9ACTN|nr:helix-hairpin-helix domain-containing protein [Geodermatophilus amargosae]SFT98203.1 competence protein ComEA [Geodermatophilus amargosae]
MRLTSRRDPAADVIRARLRVLLDEGRRSGWLPDDDPLEDPPRTGVALLRPTAHDPDDAPDDASGDDGEEHLPGGLGRHQAPGRAVRVDPGRRGNAALWLTGLLAALALSGWTWLQRPEVAPAPEPTVVPAVVPAVEDDNEGTAVGEAAEVAEARGTVVVSVVGLVVSPGLVTLPEGARVADAVAAAGGFLPEADPASVNLAAVVSDGQQVAVGVPGVAAPASGPTGGAAPAGPLDLNAATVADLDALPGIGPVLAQRIVDHREQHGRFTNRHLCGWACVKPAESPTPAAGHAREQLLLAGPVPKVCDPLSLAMVVPYSPCRNAWRTKRRRAQTGPNDAASFGR